MTEQTAWIPEPGDRYLSVWPHTLGDYEKYPDAVGTVDSGVLYVWRGVKHGDHPIGPDKSRPPLKVYAPGYWATYEHVGDYTAPRPYDTDNPADFTARYGVGKQALLKQAEQLTEQKYGMAGERWGDAPVSNPPTEEIPVYRDPTEKLAPELLDEENGDVNSHSGVGVLVPRAGGGVAPKGEAPEEGDAGSPDTGMSVGQFVFGDLLERPRRWLRARHWQSFRGQPEPTLGRTPTHLLSAVLPTSRTTWWLLAGLLPLLALVLTTR